ncbi:hypothetical protein [Massilia sp. DD77]|uniref:hypothetical protein n=1 Tax=Massilia sp. DD77 TaxID=3109349 RepID=UPI003000C1DB
MEGRPAAHFAAIVVDQGKPDVAVTGQLPASAANLFVALAARAIRVRAHRTRIWKCISEPRGIAAIRADPCMRLSNPFEFLKAVHHAL